MEDHVIETSIDQLIHVLKERGKMNVSEAADFLRMTQKEIEPILNTLEENSIIEIKYPVIGEPRIILKPNAPERIEIRKSQIKEVETPKAADEETSIERATISEKLEMRPEIRSGDTEIVNKKMEKLENEVFALSNKVDTSIFKEDLAEILLIIAGLRDVEKISFYLKEVMSIVHKMKEKGTWTDEDKDLVATMLKDIANNWNEYGNMDIAKVFDGVREKIESA